MHIEDLAIVVITQSQAWEIEENWANLEGGRSCPHQEVEDSFQRDEELSRWGDLDIVTWCIDEVIAKEQEMETLPLSNPNILIGLGLPKPNNEAPLATTH